MSLLSEREKMIMAGKATDATRDELLRAAILESNERYEADAKEIIAELKSLRAAVRASNEQRAIDVQEALKNASEAILEDVRGKAGEYIAAVEAATAKLQAAKAEKARNDRWENIKELFFVFAVIVAAFAIGVNFS
ncbi:hypothetical protein [Campylobacter sp.]|uniref:hypothetical protein n=1 Tax=Campylobacter sp. TaxID=205 RepID=UPI00361D5A98